ncbi:MAG: HAD family phosphatase [Lachnospiraceae bacterium]|jgi:putative hydrolase of the HAD superfamily|nr:HAD family phosphatase [Lachnospiraceae bacterium]MCI9251366.1 HAD family phosphatase [Lachnospiraceae bacterium]MCI9383958.1 HAD family phosphatase [Lachnospiraceae bacterium]MCI9477824.1 HAD family phosphatase [Lachnospiraceae bacterium]MCI9622230.1 HAD family phosphatase [Lachnospiraceae bacterium]
MKITTIIFDLGRVLVGYGWEAYLRKLVPEPAAYEAVERAVFKSPAWVEHDKGLLGREEEIMDFVAAAPEYEKEIRAVYENLGECTWSLDYAVPWIQELKEKGYRVYALSNWPEHIYQQRGDKLDLLELMDGYFLSFQEHLIKPDEKAFLRLMEKYGIEPGEAVFLDDTRANVLAAERLGIHGILFTSQQQAREELAKLGVQ